MSNYEEPHNSFQEILSPCGDLIVFSYFCWFLLYNIFLKPPFFFLFSFNSVIRFVLKSPPGLSSCFNFQTSSKISRKLEVKNKNRKRTKTQTLWAWAKHWTEINKKHLGTSFPKSVASKLSNFVGEPQKWLQHFRTFPSPEIFHL